MASGAARLGRRSAVVRSVNAGVRGGDWWAGGAREGGRLVAATDGRLTQRTYL